MAFTSRFKSIHSVIESAYRDSGAEEIDYDIAIADTVELLGLMGVPYNYVDKSTNGIDSPVIEVVNYRAELPFDMISLTSIRKVKIDSNMQILGSEEMIETSDLYHQTQLSVLSNVNYLSPTSNVNESTLVDDELVTEEMQIVGPTVQIYKEMPYAYKINNNILFTNFKEGYVDIEYKGYQTDTDGMIMIPDDEKLSTALKYHMIYKYDWRKWRAFPEKPGLAALKNDSEMQRDFYVPSARNKSHIPTVDKMEAIKNRHLRTNTPINEHGNGFRTLNTKQYRKF